MQKTARKFVAQWETARVVGDGEDVAISHNTRQVALYCDADFYFQL